MTQAGFAALFKDGKADDAMRTIGEVSKALKIKPHVLRYWEQQFEMLQPLKRSGNRRLYRPEDIALVAEIDRLLHKEGYTLKGARAALQKGSAPVGEAEAAAECAASFAGNDAVEVLPQLRAIRAKLASALAA